MSIKEYAKELKLSYIFHNHEQLIQEAEEKDLTLEQAMEDILEKEIAARDENGIARRIRTAKFPYKKYYVDFTTKHFDDSIAKHIKKLSKLDFIDNNENIILIGNPGTGKTHLAIALGMEACMNKKSVLFVSVPNLIIELREAMTLNQLHTYKKKFNKYDLVILDELGYISFGKEGNEILFNLLSERNDVGSTIITTNLVFDRWNEIFKDPV